MTITGMSGRFVRILTGTGALLCLPGCLSLQVIEPVIAPPVHYTGDVTVPVEFALPGTIGFRCAERGARFFGLPGINSGACADATLVTMADPCITVTAGPYAQVLCESLRTYRTQTETPSQKDAPAASAPEPALLRTAFAPAPGIAIARPAPARPPAAGAASSPDTVVVEFVEASALELRCAERGAKMMAGPDEALACADRLMVTAVNPCTSDHQSWYTRTLCHELAHVNGWPADHPAWANTIVLRPASQSPQALALARAQAEAEATAKADASAMTLAAADIPDPASPAVRVADYALPDPTQAMPEAGPDSGPDSGPESGLAIVLAALPEKPFAALPEAVASASDGPRAHRARAPAWTSAAASGLADITLADDGIIRPLIVDTLSADPVFAEMAPVFISLPPASAPAEAAPAWPGPLAGTLHSDLPAAVTRAIARSQSLRLSVNTPLSEDAMLALLSAAPDAVLAITALDDETAAVSDAPHLALARYDDGDVSSERGRDIGSGPAGYLATQMAQDSGPETGQDRGPDTGPDTNPDTNQGLAIELAADLAGAPGRDQLVARDLLAALGPALHDTGAPAISWPAPLRLPSSSVTEAQSLFHEAGETVSFLGQ